MLCISIFCIFLFTCNKNLLSPKKVMEETTAISSLGHRRDEKSHTSGEIEMFTSHPIKIRINGMNRIKRESLVPKYSLWYSRTVLKQYSQHFLVSGSRFHK